MSFFVLHTRLGTLYLTTVTISTVFVTEDQWGRTQQAIREGHCRRGRAH